MLSESAPHPDPAATPVPTPAPSPWNLPNALTVARILLVPAEEDDLVELLRATRA